jgi:hypothetical protein
MSSIDYLAATTYKYMKRPIAPRIMMTRLVPTPPPDVRWLQRELCNRHNNAPIDMEMRSMYVMIDS